MINLKKLVSLFFQIIISGAKSPDSKRYFLKYMCVALEKSTNEYISYNCRPKIADYVINKKIEKKSDKKCAIIMQGPILKEDNFTIEAAKFYKKMYPEECIIVSTWEDTEEDIVKKLKELDIEVVLNKAPETTGLGNVNYQVLSARGGLKRARELKCDYVLKTRTDQRISMPNFLSYFLGLLDTYPLERKSEKIENRLIITSGIIGANMFIPYMLSDFLFFGTINDVDKVFDLEQDPLDTNRSEREELTNKLFDNASIEDFYEKTAPESRIIKTYIDKYTDIDADGSLKSYWDFIRDYTVILSIRDMDLYGRRYNIYEESEITKIYARDDDESKNYRYIWTFANWSMLYSGRFIYNPELELYKNQIMRR